MNENEFLGVLRDKVKVYVDPNPDAPLVVGYKGSDGFKIPEGRTEFGPGADWNHRQCVACGGQMNPAPCPDPEREARGRCLVWHGWLCSQCGGRREDDAAFEASMSRKDYEPNPGYFYCPYLPEGLKFDE